MRAADAKGEPLATNYTDCLPDGMPTMMGAMFPMEILQSRGQVTIIEEAFTQVRRILMDKPQKSFDGGRTRVLRTLGRALGRRHAGR